MFFGFKPKLNAKSFASGRETYRGPYTASSKSVRQSNEYLENNIVDFNTKIVNGFRDAGRYGRYQRRCIQINKKIS